MHKTKERILITAPSPQLPGGVANFYSVFRKYSSSNIEFLTVGRRRVKENLHQTLMRFLKDYCLFMFKMVPPTYQIVILNPSLDPKSLFRDGIYLLIAKLLNRKVVVFFRGWDVEYENIIFRKYIKIFRLVFFKADAIIVLASQFKKKIEHIGYNNPIFLGTTVVDDKVFSYYPKVLKHAVDNNTKTHFNMLFLSRIERNKGIYEAIDAYCKLKPLYPNISMTIAGSGNDLEKVKDYIDGLETNDIELLGYIKGSKKHYTFSKANAYLFPTTHGEGMPTSVLEAMAYGLPVLTRPVGGIEDFFENGKMGFLTESLDPKVFADMLEKLITNKELALTMGEYNYNYAKSHFSSSIVFERIEKICEAVMQKRNC